MRRYWELNHNICIDAIAYKWRKPFHTKDGLATEKKCCKKQQQTTNPAEKKIRLIVTVLCNNNYARDFFCTKGVDEIVFF